MNKKHYIQPTAKGIQIESLSLLADSPARNSMTLERGSINTETTTDAWGKSNRMGNDNVWE